MLPHVEQAAIKTANVWKEFHFWTEPKLSRDYLIEYDK